MRVLLAPTHDDAFELLQLLDRRNVTRAVIALSDAGLIQTIVADRRVTSKDNQINRIKRISPEARRLVGLWPTPEWALDRMIASLQPIEATSTGPDEFVRAPQDGRRPARRRTRPRGGRHGGCHQPADGASAAVEAAATSGRFRRGRFPASAALVSTAR